MFWFTVVLSVILMYFLIIEYCFWVIGHYEAQLHMSALCVCGYICNAIMTAVLLKPLLARMHVCVRTHASVR